MPVFNQHPTQAAKPRMERSPLPAFAGMGNAELQQRVVAPEKEAAPEKVVAPEKEAAPEKVVAEQAQAVASPREAATPERAGSAPSLEAIRGGAELQKGQSGPAVLAVQERLNRLGFGVQPTGTFGPTTVAVVEAFQGAYRIEQTGKVGPTTLLKLEAAERCAVTLDQLRRIVPTLDETRARTYLPFLNASMEEAHVDSEARKSAYLAQLAHETDGFNTLEEYASGAAYEGRSDLGNLAEGDGRRFKGRGAIQLTGRVNYHNAGEALGVDLENHPEMAAEPELAFRVSAWYWTTHGLNRLADDGDFAGVTEEINGGQRGADSREAYHDSAKKALPPTPEAEPSGGRRGRA